MSGTTVNFSFLSQHEPVLLSLAALAERFVFEDPNTALIKIRQLAETLAKGVAAQVGLPCGRDQQFADVERSLRDRGLLDQTLHQVMRTVRLAGNDAVHELSGSRREALHQLKLVRQLAVWFHKTVTRNSGFQAGSFVPPPDPANADAVLQEQLQQLREALEKQRAELQGVQLEAAELAQRVEAAKVRADVAYQNELAALDLAAETEAAAKQQIAEYEQLLEELSKQQAQKPVAEQEQVVAVSQKAATDIDLDEFDTRKLIDQQLRDAGWEADTPELKHSKGTRPQKGRNLAIAEWPTSDGIADYILFAGLTPIATVEAKRRRRNAKTALDQSARYSKNFSAAPDLEPNGGPWQQFQIPFVFATNGNPFHRQAIDHSGVWFRDVRLETNHPRPLTGWYTPEGLQDLLKQDVEKATRKLEQEPKDYLPLRYYQRDALTAVEHHLAQGRTELLIAMATGTGKTRTAICMLYRFIKSGRFNRILFVVDRRALGEQAMDSFKDVKVDNLQSFPEIYDVRALGDISIDRDTKLHICTIQSLVRRVIDINDDQLPLPVDQYDCIVVDECHRGYILDKEMSNQELTYRDQLDYVSRYRRVLDHFDSIRIGLTATPAVHTVTIFNDPIFTYSYRQAVIDNMLVDYEPPTIIRTELSERGMKWEPGEVVKYFDTFTKTVTEEITEDEIQIDLEGFNRIAITESFNRVVCQALASCIDPELPGKTLIFCVLDSHADMVVRLLTEALEAEYDRPIHHDTVKKITGDVDRTQEAIRIFKNESLPKFVVTVDLLTTGIDVPAITNIVFLRCTKSRILFEQMIGRATRLCSDLFGPGIHKEYFHIYDAVGQYAAMQARTTMKPVVASPKTTFAQLCGYLYTEEDASVLSDVQEQIVAKLRRKAKTIQDKWQDEFTLLAGGDAETTAQMLQIMTPAAVFDWFKQRPGLAAALDKLRPGSTQLISFEPDRVLAIESGYSVGQKPADYLESFRKYLQENQAQLPALLLVTQRPTELTRKDLRELQIQLAQHGFSESHIKSAVRDTTNQDIAASIIGFVRHMMLNEPLLPYEERVDKAVRSILSSQAWEPRQRQWLERIGRQMKENVVLDRDALDSGAFKDVGGFVRLNKVFDGKLEDIIRRIINNIWQAAG